MPRRLLAPEADLYDDLPSVEEARMMTSWVECPVHHLKAGCLPDGTLVGRCAECAGEAALAIRSIERSG